MDNNRTKGDHQFRMSRRDAFESENVPRQSTSVYFERRQRRRYGRHSFGTPYIQNNRRYTWNAEQQRPYEPKQELSYMIKRLDVEGTSTIERRDEEEIERRIAEIRKQVEKRQEENPKVESTSSVYVRSRRKLQRKVQGGASISKKRHTSCTRNDAKDHSRKRRPSASETEVTKTFSKEKTDDLKPGKVRKIISDEEETSQESSRARKDIATKYLQEARTKKHEEPVKQSENSPAKQPEEAHKQKAERTGTAKSDAEKKPTSLNEFKKLRKLNKNTTNNSSTSTSSKTGEDFNWFKDYYAPDQSCERPNWRSHSIFASERDSEQQRSNSDGENSKDKMEVLVTGIRRLHFDGSSDNINGPPKKRKKIDNSNHSLTTKKVCRIKDRPDDNDKTNSLAAVNLKAKDESNKKNRKQKTKNESKLKTNDKPTKKDLRPHGKPLPGTTIYTANTSTSIDELPIAELSIAVNKPKPKQLSRLLPAAGVPSGSSVQTKPALKQIQRISAVESERPANERNNIAFLIYRFQKLKI